MDVTITMDGKGTFTVTSDLFQVSFSETDHRLVEHWSYVFCDGDKPYGYDEFMQVLYHACYHNVKGKV